MTAAWWVRPWVSTPPVTTRVRLAILSLPFLPRTRARAGRAGGQASDGLGTSKLVSGHAVGPVACMTMTGPTVSRQIPHMTPAGQPTSESDPPPNPGPSSPNEPGGIFTANLKGVELANFAGDTVVQVANTAEQGIHRICDEQQLVWSFLA